MATPVVNGAQSKPSFASKINEGNKEDVSQRRTPQPKTAWASGINPITQRSNTPTQMNGAGSKPVNGAEKVVDRQTWMYCNSVGLQCTISLKTGEKFSGIFASATKPSENQKLLFKMVKDLTNNGLNGELCGHGPEHMQIFDVSALETFEVPEAPPLTKSGANGAQAGFRTDADISGNIAIRERNLQRWEAPSGKDVDMSLESAAGGEWDQFKTNEQKFGLKSDYDENLYTTTIDYSSPHYAQRAREAERIAREIEHTASTNAHVREERGHNDDGVDEEEKYSGVRRDFQPLESNQPNRYIPPSKRGQPASGTAPVATTSKAPVDLNVDPAIISSQIARPEASTDGTKTIPSKPAPTKPSAAPLATAMSGLSINTSTAASKEVKPAKASGKGTTATDNVESELLDSFRQFAANEKIKVQDHKRSRAFQDKAVKLNDLMKFSQNFKLLTPVPKDLVPILAKDETKQKEIVQKAQLNAQTKSTKPAVMTDLKSNRPLAAARWENESSVPATDGSKDRGRQSSAQIPGSKDRSAPREQAARAPPTSLSTRLSDNHQAHRAGLAGQAPHPLNTRDNRGKGGRDGYQNLPSPQKTSNSRGPSSATSLKFNAKAMEFNPAASAFKPQSISGPTAASSPRSGQVTRTISPAASTASIFGDRKDFTTPEGKDPLRVPLKEPVPDPLAGGNDSAETKAAANALAANGGYPNPYRTAPTWPADDPENGPDAKAVLEQRRPRRHNHVPTASPNSAMAHQYQLPPHLQQGVPGGPHVQPGQHNHHQPHQQPHHYGPGSHYDDHQMRPSHSQSGYAHSPRMQAQTINYQSTMPPNAHLAYPPVQYPGQGHPMGARQYSNGPMPVPMQGGHLAPMMAPPGQPGFMPPQMGMPFNPQQMPMYVAPGGQPIYGAPSQPPSGYPSPGRGPPMMMHQGSQQGHQPVYMPQQGQFGQPVYAQHPPHMAMRSGFGSPQPPYAQNAYPQQQQHHYLHQPHRTPSSTYAQPHQPQPQHQHVQSQHGPPQPSGPAEMADEGK